MELIPEDVVACGWQAAVAAAKDTSNFSIADALRLASIDAQGAGNERQAAALKLLSAACLMLLAPASVTNPFRAFAQFESGRTAIPEDFSEVEISALRDAATRIENPTIRARLADLSWFRDPKGGVAPALVAIDAYMSMELTDESWIAGAGDGWHRALVVAQLVGEPGADRARAIEKALVSALLGRVTDNFLSVRIAETLVDQKCGRGHEAEIADALLAQGQTAANSGDHHRAESFLDAACNWARRSKDNAKFATACYALAKSWEAEAERTGASSQFRRAWCLENALKQLRRIPRAGRASNHEGDVSRLRSSLAVAQEASVEESRELTAPRIEITSQIERSRALVSGLSLGDALINFVSMHAVESIGKREERALSRARRFPLQHIFETQHLTGDGRVAARSPAVGIASPDSPELRESLRGSMIRDFQLEIGLLVVGSVLPALEVINLEHRVSLSDLAAVVRSCPFIAPSRVRLVSRGLLAGFEGEFDVALHLLTPQVEHLVRTQLKRAGIHTTSIDPLGVENEVGLSALMQKPETARIFGDIQFEIEAVFTDGAGPNLRNEVAHGLVSDEGSGSEASVFVWYFMLKLVVSGWKRARDVAAAAVSTQPANGPESAPPSEK